MGYRLKRKKSPAEEVRRVALDQVERAIAEVSEPETPASKRVHSVRKRFKKLRSLFRLLKSVDPQAAEHENARFRRLGRELSSQRDDDVLLSTLQKITNHSDNHEQPTSEIEQLHRSLNDQHQRNQNTTSDPLRTVELQLHAAKESLLDWQPAEFSYRDLVKEFVNHYRRGRKSLHKANRETSSERMHDLRKRTKDFGYQLQLLRDFCNKSAKSKLPLTDKAGLKLGRDHDLAMLSERVEEKLRKSRRSNELKALKRKIAKRRRRLNDDCLSLCGKLYRERSKKLRGKLSVKETPSKAHA